MYSYEPSGYEIFLKIWTADNLKIKITIEHNTAINTVQYVWAGLWSDKGAPTPIKATDSIAALEQPLGAQGSVSLHQKCPQWGSAGNKHLALPFVATFLFYFFKIFVLLIISLDNIIVRCYYLSVKHMYSTVLLLSWKLCESKNLFNIFDCNQIHSFLNWDWRLAFNIESTGRWRPREKVAVKAQKHATAMSKFIFVLKSAPALVAGLRIF